MNGITRGFSVEVDHLVLGSPGTIVPADKTTLSPPKLKRNFKVTEGFGLEGAFCSYTGEGLAMFDATFEFWSEEKEPLWAAFASAHLMSPSRRPAALSIYHPILMQPPFRIQNVQVTEIEGWSLVTPGKWQTRLSFLEYRAQKPFVPKKTEPTVPGADKVVPDRPKTAQDKKMANAAARLKWVGEAGAKARFNVFGEGDFIQGDEGFVPPYPGY